MKILIACYVETQGRKEHSFFLTWENAGLFLFEVAGFFFSAAEPFRDFKLVIYVVNFREGNRICHFSRVSYVCVGVHV